MAIANGVNFTTNIASQRRREADDVWGDGIDCSQYIDRNIAIDYQFNAEILLEYYCRNKYCMVHRGLLRISLYPQFDIVHEATC